MMLINVIYLSLSYIRCAHEFCETKVILKFHNGFFMSYWYCKIIILTTKSALRTHPRCAQMVSACHMRLLLSSDPLPRTSPNPWTRHGRSPWAKSSLRSEWREKHQPIFRCFTFVEFLRKKFLFTECANKT